MTGWREQAEQEMWDAAATSDRAPVEPAYAVYTHDTGALCLSTDDLDAACARADTVAGYVTTRYQNVIYDTSNPSIGWLRRTDGGYEIRDRL